MKQKLPKLITKLTAAAVLALFLFLAAAAGGCSPGKQAGPGEKEPEKTRVTLINPTGPTVIPTAGIASGNVTGNADITIHYWRTMDEVMAFLASGDAQVAIMPVTAGANLYNNNVDIILAGVHTWKLFYMVTSESPVFQGWQFFKGQEIYTPVARGQTVDVIMRSAMHNEGLDPDTDVKIVYAPPQEIVALFKEGRIKHAALPEPFATLAVQGDKGSIVLDFQEYWGELTGLAGRFPITGIFVLRSFYEENPGAVAEVLTMLDQSIDWAMANPEAAVEAVSDVLPIPKEVMLLALKRIDFSLVLSPECMDEVDAFFQKTKEIYPESPPAPDKGFYKQ